MTPGHGTSLETRPSLLKRLKSGDDLQSWQEFYRIYGGLIRFFAEKAGLTADEAEEVVQETAIGVARRLPEFVYDPKVCRFKTWLLNLVRWRIQDQLRKRPPEFHARAHRPPQPDAGDAGATATEEGIVDPAGNFLEAIWDEEWAKNVLDNALDRLKHQVNARHFQIFYLTVIKKSDPQDVARVVGVNVDQVYLIKHRLTPILQKAIHDLEIAH